MKLRLAPAFLASLMALGPASATAASAHAGRPPATRVSKEHVAAPAQFDLSLAEISFGSPAHVAGTSTAAARAAAVSAIRLAVRGAAGLNYVAGAVTRFRVHGRPRVLVLVVNRRPRGSLAPDLARIALTLTAPRRLGAPVLVQISNLFTRATTGLQPALCDLPIHGSSLTASDLRPVLTRGLPVTAAAAAFSAEAAVAQAYDATCGRPYDPAFRQAVTQGSTPACQPGPASILACCPPNAMCVPPPCPPCPCGLAPCPAPPARLSRSAIACPLQKPPVACPLSAR